MAADLRRTGIGVVGEAPWGTHGCLFYDTQEDLIETVVSFFKSGLEQGEACLWITSNSLNQEDARSALRQSVSDLDRYFDAQCIELIPYEAWYFEDGVFSPRCLVKRFHDKLGKVLAQGRSGLRMTGDSSWLKEHARAHICEYEIALNDVIAGQPVMVLCTYPFAQTSAAELLDVARAHPVCVSVRKGDWEIIETPELKEAKAEIKKLNQFFEQKVVERTRALHKAIEVLKSEIEERARVEEELRRQKEVLEKIFDHIPVMIALVSPRNRIEIVNREWERVLGWSLDEIRASHVDIVAECYPDPRERQRVWDFISSSTAEWNEFKTRVRDGRVIDTSWANVHLSDGTSIGFGRDITEKKQALEKLEATMQRLRSFSANIQATREEERTRLARWIHDELGSAFTSWKWDLESFDRALAEPLDGPRVKALRAKIAGMVKLADSTIDVVRRIAWELRPSILDDLGLVEAIESQAQQFEARTGIVCGRSEFLDEIRFTQAQATAIFRIFQEALTNVLRHARATRVDIAMSQEAGEFVLAISDNGRGITGIEKSGLGILGMQERARMVGGKIDIQGREGAGTTIVVRIPLVQPGPEAAHFP